MAGEEPSISMGRAPLVSQERYRIPSVYALPASSPSNRARIGIMPSADSTEDAPDEGTHVPLDASHVEGDPAGDCIAWSAASFPALAVPDSREAPDGRKLRGAGRATDVAIDPATSMAATAIMPSLATFASADVVVVSVWIMIISNALLSSVNETR